MFNTLHRYVLREFLKIFSLSLSSLIVIYLVVLFLQRLNLLIQHHAPFYLIFEYLLYRIPEVLFRWTTPYAVLMATLLTLGMFSRHSEITAMKAGGVSLYRITFPLLLLAIVIGFFCFLGSEYLIPAANQKTQYLLDVQVRKEQPSTFFKNFKIWYHGDHQIFNIQLLDPEKKMLKGLTLYQFDDSFRCTERVDAREAKWAGGTWTFYDGSIRKFSADGSVEVTPFTERNFSLQETWESFRRVDRRSDELSYTELVTYIEKIRSAGYDATRYLVDLHAKLSQPFLNVVMVLIGIPFALKTARSSGVASNITICVLIAFSYGIIFYVFLSFGKSGVLPPFLSAWTPTLLFSLAGIFTLMSVKQ